MFIWICIMYPFWFFLQSATLLAVLWLLGAGISYFTKNFPTLTVGILFIVSLIYFVIQILLTTGIWLMKYLWVWLSMFCFSMTLQSIVSFEFRLINLACISYLSIYRCSLHIFAEAKWVYNWLNSVTVLCGLCRH